MGDLADNQPWQLGPGVTGTQSGGYGGKKGVWYELGGLCVGVVTARSCGDQ